jgi:hypothetical protein
MNALGLLSDPSPVNMAAFDPQMFNGRSPIGQVPAFVYVLIVNLWFCFR